MKKNLLFYLYPVKGSCWEWHIESLVHYQKAWNGRKVIVVSEDSSTVSLREVREAATPLDVEFFKVKNDPKLNEVPHFHRHLSLFESLDPNEALFYGHGKGVTRKDCPQQIRAWTEAMYYLNLTYPELIDALLLKYKSIGAFRHYDEKALFGSRWFFGGAFFWLRHDALFGSSWRNQDTDRYGVERFPGRIVQEKESISLTPGIDNPANLYQNIIPKEKYSACLEAVKKRFFQETHRKVTKQ